jgi:Peptidase family S41/N-terminal domain of Peptidase_S41 in eukaryotic IRBP
MIARVRGTLAAASTLLLALVSWTTASPQARGAHAAPFAPAIETLTRKLEADYVFPDVGAKYAAALRGRLAAGDYDGVTDAGQIATRLTADLQATRWEGHLRVRVAGAAPSNATRASSDAPPPIKDAKWIAPGVAYIAFTLMPDDPQVVSAVDSFMREHASARVLIIDARENHGGGEGVPNAIFRYLYSKQQVLSFFDERADVADDSTDDPYERPPTITKAPGPPGIVRTQFTVIPDPDEHRLFHAKVLYLTSAKTGSAAEQMAEALKRTRRGVIVGERTAGAGHFGFFVPIGQGLEAFIPWGRVLDPVTGEDYEGRGVTPDVAVSADQALDTALRMASP